MTRVLVVEDEESFSDALSYMLRREGYEVAVAGTGPEALQRLRPHRRRPGAARPDAARAVRHRGVPRRCGSRSNVPIIMVTARDTEVDKVVGLELGADDYVTKPFSSRELVGPDPGRAAPRRRARGAADLDAVEAGPVRMDVERHVVTVDGAPGRRCRSRSSTCSSCCCATPAGCSPAGQLIDRVWGADYVGDTKTLDVHVKRLRAKIEPDPANPKYLVTVRGLGYKFEILSPLDPASAAVAVGSRTRPCAASASCSRALRLRWPGARRPGRARGASRTAGPARRRPARRSAR